jgi:GH15 family glucan-1,4-alpha-glucosidase
MTDPSRTATPPRGLGGPAAGAALPDERYPPIEHHGVIGDLNTVALVRTDATIDWFCPQRFDAPSLFAAILDADRGGAFELRPVGQGFASKQIYLPDTAVLITRFFSPDGVGEVVDCMPIRDEGHCAVIRTVRVVRGEIAFEARCRPAFDYAREPHRVEITDHGARFVGSRSLTALTASIPLRAEGDAAVARFVLGPEDRVALVLHPLSGDDAPWTMERAEREIAATSEVWRRWLAKSRYTGRWREMVDRSAITLKLLTYRPTGAVVAAATTSLPELVGGGRNWDYRYAWLRDSAFTVFAFIRLGFYEEAAHFMDWLEARCTESQNPELQIMYGVGGEADLPEEELRHLEGYRGSQPVRIGNGAHSQLQLDVYGELMDAVYLSDRQNPISYDLWRHLRRTLDWLADNWAQPDEGVWEVRGGRRDFVYSRLMCWVAFERALRIQNFRGLPADTARWRAVRDDIYEDIMTNGWSEERGSFVQYYGGEVLDASNLLMPLVKFVGPKDPRILSTLDAIGRDLVSDSLVYRYDPEQAAADGLEGREGSFSLCSFWLVECLTRAGRHDEARFVFEKMLSYANHVGLYAEQIGESGQALGNFPQAFTHLALISAAYDLNRALDRRG